MRRDAPQYAPAPEYVSEMDDDLFRERRDSPPAYGHPAPAYHAPKGRVGPVYTFVKTDPQVIESRDKHKKKQDLGEDNIHYSQANFKWGVRHRAGAQYGR